MIHTKSHHSSICLTSQVCYTAFTADLFPSIPVSVEIKAVHLCVGVCLCMCLLVCLAVYDMSTVSWQVRGQRLIEQEHMATQTAEVAKTLFRRLSHKLCAALFITSHTAELNSY